MDDELVARHRALQIGLELDALEYLGAHRRLEEGVPALAVGLGAVHRDVGVAQQLLAAPAAHDDPDRGGDEDLAALDLERRVQRLDDALGDGDGLALGADVLEEHGELVAAEPRGGVARAQAAVQA